MTNTPEGSAMSEIKTAEERLAVDGAYSHSDMVLNTVTLSFAKYAATLDEASELRAAYEALKAEKDAQAKRIAELEKGLTEISEWTKRYTTPGHPISTVADRLLAASKNGDSK